MKRGVVILFSVILLVSFSLMANGLVSETRFNDTFTSKLLDFSQNYDLSVYVKLVSHAYVISTNLTLTGLLSDWETVRTYNSSTSPVSSQYISNNKWLITDDAAGATNDVVLYNPSTQSITASYDTSSAISDGDYVSDEIWLVADRTIDAALLINSTDDSIISNFSGLSNPEAVDYITPELWLIGDTGNNRVILVNVTSQSIVKSLTGLGSVKDVQAVSTEMWLIVDAGNTKTFLHNSTSGSNSTYNGLLIPSSVDYVSDEIWLVSLNTVNKKISLLNVTSSTEIAVYQDASLSEPRDARYIGANNWLITDKSGTREVHEMKKYYPTNLTMTVGNDLIKTWSGNFNSSDVVENFTDAMNSYLVGCFGCNIPLTFHSDTSGKLNLTLLNVTYNRKPNVTITAPQAGAGWTNNESFNWTMSDDDGDVLTADIYFWNGTNLNQINVTVGTPSNYNLGFDTTPYSDDDGYWFRIIVNDTYNNASDDSGNFTIDNTNPGIDNLTVSDADGIVRSDAVLTFSVWAYDLFMANVNVNGSNMIEGLGNIWSNSSTPVALGCVGGANNSCVLTAVATDIVNRQNTTSLTIVIDDVNPSIWNLTSNATSDQSNKDDSVNFTVEASDVNMVGVSLNGSNMAPGNGYWYLVTQPMNLGCSAGSVCELTATATDYAGNTNSTNYNLTINADPFFIGGGRSGGGSTRKVQCDDGIDNDGDGLIDMADPGCSSEQDDDEYHPLCEEKWTCSNWGECVDGKQTRSCEEINGCDADFFKPLMEQDCEAVEIPETTFEVESTPKPLGVGQAVSLFDRIKANWWAILLALAVIGGLAVYGWRKGIFKKRGQDGPGTNIQN